MRNRLSINELAFLQPLSIDARYQVGLMASDGCVCIDQHGNKYIGFGSKDKKLVEDFKLFLSAECATRSTRNIPSVYSILIQNARLFDDLVVLGVTPRKSLDLVICEELVKDCDFWRGGIDGDGCIHWQGNTPVLVLATSSIAFANQFLEFSFSICKSGAIYKVKGGSKLHPSINPGYQVRVAGRACAILLKSIYRPGAPALARKRQLAEEVFAFYSDLYGGDTSAWAKSGWALDSFGNRLSLEEIAAVRILAQARVAAHYGIVQEDLEKVA
jgi:hypothetical protein